MQLKDADQGELTRWDQSIQNPREDRGIQGIDETRVAIWILDDARKVLSVRHIPRYIAEVFVLDEEYSPSLRSS